MLTDKRGDLLDHVPLVHLRKARAETAPISSWSWEENLFVTMLCWGSWANTQKLASRGEARILAVMSCNRNRWNAPAIDVINTYYGRPDIPVGASRTGPEDEIWYHDAVPGFPHRLAASGDAPEGVYWRPTSAPRLSSSCGRFGEATA